MRGLATFLIRLLGLVEFYWSLKWLIPLYFTSPPEDMTRMEAYGVNAIVVVTYLIVPILIFSFAPRIAKVLITVSEQGDKTIIIETQTFMQAGLALLGVGMISISLMDLGSFLPHLFRNFAEGAKNLSADLSFQLGYRVHDFIRCIVGLAIGVGLLVWSKYLTRKLLK